MENQHRIWNLLVKKDMGKASQAELLELERLLEEEADIHRVIKDLDNYWSRVSNSPETEEMNAMADSNRLLAEMKIDRFKAKGSYRDRIRIRKFMGIAAIIVTILCATTLIYYLVVRSTDNSNIVRTKNGSRTEVTLPDGTRVSMNGGSVLTYPDNFKNAAKREVTISGEAFFDVKHDSSHPFVIHTQYLDIRDIGTVFNVRAYPDEASEATLISGSIEVNIRNQPERVLKLRPQEKVVYGGQGQTGSRSKRSGKSALAKNGELRVIKVAPIIGNGGDTIVPETAWTQNRLVFQSEPFESLAGRMERWYNVKIYFKNEEVQHYVFSGIFEGETLEESLRELQLSRPFNYTVAKDSVIVTANQPSVEDSIQ